MVHTLIRFDTKRRRLSVADATEMRNKVADLREGESLFINFEPIGQALLNQGKVRESLHAYRELIEQHPKEAVHHLQVARALLAAGLGQSARDEAQLAVKLEPTSALAQKTLADILQSDLVGRRLRPGSDYAGAAAAFRAAKKLDPNDAAIAGNLAILLEYNDDGARYAPGSHLQEAIAEYRSLPREELAEIGLQNNLSYTLFYAGEFAEAQKNALALNPQPKSLIVACAAVTNGSKAALDEASKRSTGDAEYRQVVKAAGDMLMNVRKYELAADLMEAGASGDNAARAMSIASMLRKARKHEELVYGNDPSGAVKRFVLLSIDPLATIEKMNAVLSKNGRLVLKNSPREDIDSLNKPGKQLRHILAQGGVSPDATIDILVETIEPKGEGNDDSGYRERVIVLGGKRLTLFVVKEDGQYRVLDSSEKPNAIGLEILDRVNANNLDGARAMLDWVRDEQHLEGGDDPMAGAAFPRLWTKGKQASADQMKWAAAAILVQTKPTAKQGLEISEEAAKSATSDLEKANINLALLDGYSILDDYTKQLSVAGELAKQNPESKRIFYAESLALRGQGRLGEAEALAQERLKRMHDDTDAFRALMMNDLAREDYKAVYAWYQKIIDKDKGEAGELNGLAWQTLFFRREGGPDVESAIKATQLSQNNPHILHTLGCLYAEVGRTKEAREVLVQAMDLQNLDEPNDDFWYAFGRIAEQYGERAAAISIYGKISKPKLAIRIPDSSFRLAERRLRALQDSGVQPAGASATN